MPDFYMLAGLPSSGKSTYAKELAEKCDAVVLSYDEIKKGLSNKQKCKSKNELVFKIAKDRIENLLIDGKNVIYDDTNISSKTRLLVLNEIKKVKDVKKICILVLAPYLECLKRNTKPNFEDTIKRMYTCWSTPYYYEGWDKIEICFSGEYEMFDVYSEYKKYLDFDQNNHHHSETLGNHLYNTFLGVEDRNDSIMSKAALIHDIGKPFTKTNINGKGRITEDSHYYRHANVGAYDSLFADIEDESEKLFISTLINLHMRPYDWEYNNNMNLREKCRNLWGEELFESVEKLHEADKKSHLINK